MFGHFSTLYITGLNWSEISTLHPLYVCKYIYIYIYIYIYTHLPVTYIHIFIRYMYIYNIYINIYTQNMYYSIIHVRLFWGLRKSHHINFFFFTTKHFYTK